MIAHTYITFSSASIVSSNKGGPGFPLIKHVPSFSFTSPQGSASLSHTHDVGHCACMIVYCQLAVHDSCCLALS